MKSLSVLESDAEAGGAASKPRRHSAFMGAALVLWCGAAYLASALVTLAIARLAFGPVIGLRPTLMGPWLWIGLLVPAVLALWTVAGHTPARFWQLAWALLAAAMLANIATGFVPLVSYGDSVYLRGLIERGEPYPRWLAGTALASWLYAALWQFPPFVARLPALLATPDGFIGAAGILAMAIGTILLIRRWPGRLAVLLPTLLPVWVMFATGYREYYPFITCALLAALAWLFEGRLEERAPHSVGLLCAALPLLYIGFAPLAVLALTGYLLARPALACRALGWAGAGFIVLILVCWPAGVADFFRQLYTQLNLGELNTEFPRYMGHSAGPDSIFFTAGYALSIEHLLDVGYMAFWGGALVPIVLFVAGFFLVWRSRRWEIARLVGDRRLWLAAAVLLWQGAYLLFMIPKLGPTRDVDLFFSTFVTFAFFAGRTLDLALATNPDRAAGIRLILIAALIGNTVIALRFLLGAGLPIRT